MSGYVLALRGPPGARLDLSALLPARLAGLDAGAVERLALGQGRAPVVGDAFRVRPGEAGRLVIEGGSERLDRVGAGLDAGEVVLDGEAGFYAGAGMTGGSLIVRGSAGSMAAAGMRGGVLRIEGDAGRGLGSGAVGAPHGMAGGTVVVRGHAGPGCGERMRRGLIVVEGDVADAAANRMTAGTLVVCGAAGGRFGMLMRRGTLVAGALGVPLSVTFVPGAADPGRVFLRLLQRAVRPCSEAAAALCGRAADRFLGDMATLGLGEVFVAR